MANLRFNLETLCKYCDIMHQKIMPHLSFANFTGWSAENPEKVQQYLHIIYNILQTMKRVTKQAVQNAIPEEKKVEILREIQYIEESMAQQFVPVAAYIKRPENNGQTPAQKGLSTVIYRGQEGIIEDVGEEGVVRLKTIVVDIVRRVREVDNDNIQIYKGQH